MLRHSFIAEIVIGLREIAPAALRCIGLPQFLEKEPQIALSLFPSQRGGVARMHERQQLRRDDARRRHTAVRVAQLLMDTPLIAAPRPPAKDPRRIGVEQRFPRRLVDVMPRHQKDLAALRLRLLNSAAKVLPRLGGEIFIRINKDNPIACRMRERRVARGRKIILPHEIMDRRMKIRRRLCNTSVPCRRDKNDLVCRIPERREGTAKLMRFVFCDITGGDLHAA